jgi:hypothetical protein
LHEFLLQKCSSKNLRASANNQLRHIATSLLQPCSSAESDSIITSIQYGSIAPIFAAKIQQLRESKASPTTQQSSIAPIFAAKIQQLGGESESITQYSTD